jgi:hypothetical protein
MCAQQVTQGIVGRATKDALPTITSTLFSRAHYAFQCLMVYIYQCRTSSLHCVPNDSKLHWTCARQVMVG